MARSTDGRLRSRRELMKGAAVGSAGLALAGCGGSGGSGGSGPAVHTVQRVQWRLASSFQSNLDTIYGASTVLAERIEAMSEGRFSVRVYQAGELVPGLNVLDAVQKGSVHVGQTAGYYYTGKNTALAFDTCVPFGLSSRQQSAWILEGGGMQLLRALYADFGVRNFVGGNTGAQMGGWFQKQVGSLAELRGLKMRIPGLGGDAMAALGVSAMSLAGGEIYPALERGVIDATEWVGPYDDEKLGFYKVAKNYYYPGWWEPGPSLSFLVNEKAWSELPSAYQAMFEAATHEAAVAMQTRYDAKNPPALTRLREKGVSVRPFPDDVMQAAREVSEDLLSSAAAQNPSFARILEPWRRFRSEAFRWFATADLTYESFAYRTS